MRSTAVWQHGGYHSNSRRISATRRPNCGLHARENASSCAVGRRFHGDDALKNGAHALGPRLDIYGGHAPPSRTCSAAASRNPSCCRPRVRGWTGIPFRVCRLWRAGRCSETHTSSNSRRLKPRRRASRFGLFGARPTACSRVTPSIWGQRTKIMIKSDSQAIKTRTTSPWHSANACSWIIPCLAQPRVCRFTPGTMRWSCDPL
jgi:hypothetical protein